MIFIDTYYQSTVDDHFRLVIFFIFAGSMRKETNTKQYEQQWAPQSFSVPSVVPPFFCHLEGISPLLHDFLLLDANGLQLRFCLNN